MHRAPRWEFRHRSLSLEIQRIRQIFANLRQSSWRGAINPMIVKMDHQGFKQFIQRARGQSRTTLDG